MNSWRSLPLEDMCLVDVKDAFGILLAEDFLGIAKLPSDTALVSLKLEPGRFPFAVVPPSGPNVEPLQKKAKKTSKIMCVNEHITTVKDAAVRELFSAVSRCFLEPNDPRLSWFVPNPKVQHLGAYYKGKYILWKVARQKFFDVGYELEGQKVSYRVPETVTEPQLRAEIARILDKVDQDMAGSIGGFVWDD